MRVFCSTKVQEHASFMIIFIIFLLLFFFSSLVWQFYAMLSYKAFTYSVTSLNVSLFCSDWVVGGGVFFFSPFCLQCHLFSDLN